MIYIYMYVYTYYIYIHIYARMLWENIVGGRVFRGPKYCARSFYEAARILFKLMEESSGKCSELLFKYMMFE